MDINYFKAIQNAIGTNTKTQAVIRESKQNIANGMTDSIGLISDGKRNGNPQKFILASKISLFKYNIIAFPDEELYAGDVLELCDETWIVKEVKLSNPIQRVGIIYLSNLNLRFQNHNSNIIERPAVLDKGQYSTTIGEEKDIRYPNDKIKIYLPYDDDTKYIHMDKRIATGIVYDKYGKQILETFKITKVNHTTVNFGKYSHLLELTVESDQYSSSNDNIDEMICDYISPTDTPKPTQKLKCEIKGRPTVLLDNYRIYTPIFYDENNQEVTNIVPLWTLSELNGITSEIINNKLKIVVNDNEDLIGSVVALTLQDNDGVYEPCSMEVEVTV